MSACTTTGTAAGELVETGGKQQSVTFVWKSDPGAEDQGSMSVVLPDGSRYAGLYRQVTRQYDSGFYAPLWEGYQPYWTDWSMPGPDGSVAVDGDGWVTIYSNRVVARLDGDGAGKSMRCRFTLDQPTNGLAGGGIGDCQLANGEKVEGARLHSM